MGHWDSSKTALFIGRVGHEDSSKAALFVGGVGHWDSSKSTACMRDFRSNSSGDKSCFKESGFVSLALLCLYEKWAVPHTERLSDLST